MFSKYTYVLCLIIFTTSSVFAQCEIRGIDENAPKLCGSAIQGGMLYGKHDTDVFYGDEKISANGVFVLGLPYDAPETIDIKFCKRKFFVLKPCDTFTYNVGQRKYKSEKITVPKKFTKYSPEVNARIKRESAKVKEVRSDSHSDKSIWFKNLKIPENLKGIKISGIYGTRRVFNGETKSWHRGTDWAAKLGTPVYPFANGKVILADKYYMSGNIVIVSHGHGITTTYIHLNKINVAVGDMVDTNTKLGTVGSTGRASGPHLHAELSWGTIPLDLELTIK